MADDPGLLGEAKEQAREMLAWYRQGWNAQVSPDARETVYIIKDCDCRSQGTDNPYHVHHFTAQGWVAWQTNHHGQVVASEPV